MEKLKTFELFLFNKNREIIKLADQGGINGYIVDWENKGKSQRQLGYDTQISTDSYDDLREIRKFTSNYIICRINNIPKLIDKEIEKAICFGADEILVPMIRNVDEVVKILEKIKNRCHVALMVETREAVNHAAQLAKLPITRVFLGLQDLAIDIGYTNIFKPLCDETIEHIKKTIDVPFGFGGATLPHKGYPIPCNLLMSEYVRLGCNFTFLRRAFLKDVNNLEIPKAIYEILEYIEKLRKESLEKLEKNREILIRKIKNSDQYFDNVNLAKIR